MKTEIKKTLTHIARIRLKNLNHIERVCTLLDWTEQRFCDHQYEIYEQFIAIAMPDCEKAANVLRFDVEFCGWWINEWMHRNESDFLPYADYFISQCLEHRPEGINVTEATILDNGHFLLTDSGISIINDPVTGHHYLIDEYLSTHCAEGLYNDPNFADRYSRKIDQILLKRQRQTKP